MALTLAEASKLSQDMLLKGVIETIIQESPVLQVLPFIEVVGNGLTYNRENTLPSASFYDVGDTWAESTPTFTQVTATLKILGGDADIDKSLYPNLRTPSGYADRFGLGQPSCLGGYIRWPGDSLHYGSQCDQVYRRGLSLRKSVYLA
jgi:hypothetical protein